MLDVYIGFMDEEVSSVLIPLLDEAERKCRPIFIFERGEVDNILFERHLNSYNKEFEKIIVGGYNKEHREDVLANSVHDSMQQLFGEGIYKKSKERSFKVKQKVILNDPNNAEEKPLFIYSVLAFNHINNKNEKDSIVVIRSPEMGLQPNLLRTYLRAILRTLHLFPGFDNGVRIKVFGAGGAICEEDNPGDIHELNGSIFVGSEIRKDSTENMKYNPLVHLIGLTKENDTFIPKEFSFYQGNPYCENEKAQEDAINHFYISKEKIKAYFEKEKIKKVSLTANFFIGQDMKELGRSFGLHDANMEDYHIFKIMKSIVEKPHLYGKVGVFTETEYNKIEKKLKSKKELMSIFKSDDGLTLDNLNTILKGSDVTKKLHDMTYSDPKPKTEPSIIKGLYAVKNRSDIQNLQLNRLLLSDYLKKICNIEKVPGEFELKDFSLMRVDCDPPIIEKDVKDAFSKWCKDARYSKEKYISAIAWGLNGCDINKLDINPSDYKWEFAGEKGISADNKIFYKYKKDVLDPFYVEIATDFLADIINEKAFRGEEINNAFKDKETNNKIKKTDKLVNNAKKTKQQFYRYLKLAPDFMPNFSKNILLIDLFTNYFDTWNFATFENIGSHEEPKPSCFNDKVKEKFQEHYKIWLRYESWDLKGSDNRKEKNKKIILDGVEFAEEALDRALYKSANQVALQQLAKDQIMK